MGVIDALVRRHRIAAVGVTVAAIVATAAGPAAAQPPAALVTDPASLVDPMIGTGDGGAAVGQVDTYPGATAPFGMVSFSPDTPSRPDGGGYDIDDSSTLGFSLTHMSGPGCDAYGDFPILPTVGEIGAAPATTTAAFDHATEHAAPGSYAVRLDPAGAQPIQADLAATTRTGMAAFTYPPTASANVLFKMGEAQSGNKTADVQVVGDRTVTGTETAGQFCGSGGTYPVHFVATFDRPFASHGTWHTAPVGDNVFTAPTGQLDWSYHEVAAGGTPATITPATTSDGQSAVSWHQDDALANTWIQATPPAVTQGTSYQASVTLRGSGKVYLNFYNGRQDVGGDPVTLADKPVTVTVTTTIPTGSIGAPQFQVRTPGAGPVDAVVSGVSIRAEQVVKSTGSSTDGLGSGAWVTFDTQKQSTVRMKVGLSYVSTANAWANLARENKGWSVSRVAGATRDQWNRLLSRVRIGGGTHSQQVQFYTALYHAMLEPSTFSDADGSYLGFDGATHRTRHGQVQYANLSGWDVYRSEIPLLAMLLPDETSQMMTSLLNDQAQGGWLPKWGFANQYTDVMNGDAADPMLAEAYAFGARGFDARAALAAMVKGATVDPTPAQLGQGFYAERPQLSAYHSMGFVPNTQQSSLSPVPNGASETLEYATADFSIAALASALGRSSTAATFLKQSQNWTNIFNTATGYIEPRDGSGLFPDGDPTTSGIGSFGQTGFQEGNAAQYTWMIPQNINGLITALGGKAATIARLDTFFQQLQAGPDLPYEWAGNEPVFGAPWIYDYAGAPAKTQQIVHRLLDTVYADTPGGEPGNDDLGAMSSWYVWSSLGMYPATPGTDVLALGAPIFPRAEIDVPGGRHLSISAQGASTSTFVRSLTVDGRPWSKDWLSAGLLDTTRLTFTLGATPDPKWGTGAADEPPSYPAGPLQFPPGRKPTVLVPTGANLLGTTATGGLPWQGPVQNGVGSVPGTLAPATTPEGTSAIHWTEANAAPDTWIWVDPAAPLTAGQSYQVSVTLAGQGNVYLDFWNGQTDLSSAKVALTATPQTLTLQAAVPSAADTHLQVRTAAAGPVDLEASAASIRLLVPQT
ncbi:GH92 family glycosyl hydrolase [Actinoplanes subtropicus]|uniref:GH92 family glycosyl hydrolase n=1 Tax=Actinoplanes subtropicus TaxID=543632 RepID=UPI000ABE68C8|nr:GH92 family glycosyl hydrolase [Actinoplanes subtropicus]